MSGVLAGLIGSFAPVATSFEPIATLTGNGSATTLTFSSIPQTYQHLQIRFISRRNVGGNAGNNFLYLRFNGSSSPVYTSHKLTGNGGTATSTSDGVDANEIYLPSATAGSAQATGEMSVGILDIHDYSSSSKNTTTRYFGGNDSNGSFAGYVHLASGLYRSTSAISSISIIDSSSYAFTSSSTFALYGIKG